ncbi:MAG: nucleoside/nucleotide kinase family protein [Jatrophihabitans sp.]
MELTLAELIDRARALADTGDRTLLGITGAPGAGKSTVAETVVAALGGSAALAPMDGFHLSDELLFALGRRDRKGAPDTFDQAGFAAALRRVRAATHTVYLPRFEREREDSVAAAIAIPSDVPLVITEGNYLLLWANVAGQLDECWYLALDDDVRRERLVQRRLGYGFTEAQARRWATESDEHNAREVQATQRAADLIVTLRDPG